MYLIFFVIYYFPSRINSVILRAKPPSLTVNTAVILAPRHLPKSFIVQPRVNAGVLPPVFSQREINSSLSLSDESEARMHTQALPSFTEDSAASCPRLKAEARLAIPSSPNALSFIFRKLLFHLVVNIVRYRHRERAVYPLCFARRLEALCAFAYIRSPARLLPVRSSETSPSALLTTLTSSCLGFWQPHPRHFLRGIFFCFILFSLKHQKTQPS